MNLEVNEEVRLNLPKFDAHSKFKPKEPIFKGRVALAKHVSAPQMNHPKSLYPSIPSTPLKQLLRHRMQPMDVLPQLCRHVQHITTSHGVDLKAVKRRILL